MNYLELLCMDTNKFEGKQDNRGAFKLKCFYRGIGMAKNFLRDNPEGIAVLLEVPDLENLRIKFSEKAYKFFEPKNTEAFICTVAIANKNSGWQRMEDGVATGRDYGNRFVGLIHPEGLSLIAVDMPASKKVWDAFCEYLELNSKNQDYCLIGKFGVHTTDSTSTGIGPSEFTEQFREICALGFRDVLPEGSITYYRGKRHTEHILTNSEKIGNGQVVSAEDFSDYAIIRADYRND